MEKGSEHLREQAQQCEKLAADMSQQDLCAMLLELALEYDTRAARKAQAERKAQMLAR